MLILVLVLKDSLRTFFKPLSLSWSLGSGPCPCPWGSGPCPGPWESGPCPCPSPWGQVLVNIPEDHPPAIPSKILTVALRLFGFPGDLTQRTY